MNGSATTDVLVVGAGASGLAVAWRLARQGIAVTVLEAGAAPGGVIRSERDGDWLTEAGPNTLLVKRPLHALLAETGLAADALRADKRNAKRYILFRGRMQALPTGPLAALASPLVRPALSHLLREPWVRRGAADDETIASFIGRRLGDHVLGALVDPFVSGVYAGDPARLSVRATFPRLVALEQRYGSLVRGGLASLVAARPAQDTAVPPLPRAWRRTLISFPEGLQALPARLASQITAAGSRLLTGCAVRDIVPAACGWLARDDRGGQWQARHLVLATPAPVSAALLRPLDDALASLLDSIVYAPLASLSLGFDGGAVAHDLDGFGVLIPRSEGRRTLGALFSSTLFPGRAPAGHKLLTAFIGGRRDETVLDLDDDALVAQVMRDLGEPLGLRAQPVWRRVRRWAGAIPQYETGHIDLLRRIDGRTAGLSGLSLLGNWRDGISVGDCLDNGQGLAIRLTAEMRSGRCGA